MRIVTDLREWQSMRDTLSNKTIGFIPTMGNLHEGHLSLCRRSIAENEITLMSIFVNPTQFNEASDFDTYPRTLMQDQQLLSTLAIDYLLLPKASEIYADHYELQVSETNISTVLEGEHRPGHFTGMLTVVLKLLNLARATKAYFGEKDFQQLLLIQKMAAAFFLPTTIVACPTLRADDGLALSSRNARLSEADREKAADFPRLFLSTPSHERFQILHCASSTPYLKSHVRHYCLRGSERVCGFSHRRTSAP